MALAALAPALLVTANFVAGTDYVRQAAAFTGDQQRGVEAAIALAAARQVPVLTNWPYYYPEVPRSLDYGPFRWRTAGIELEFLAFHDFGVSRRTASPCSTPRRVGTSCSRPSAKAC